MRLSSVNGREDSYFIEDTLKEREIFVTTTQDGRTAITLFQ